MAGGGSLRGSALTDTANRASLRSKTGGATATAAVVSTWHKVERSPRNKHFSTSHHLPTIISPCHSTHPSTLIFGPCTVQFPSKLGGLFPPQCVMSAWASLPHFRVHAAHRAGSKGSVLAYTRDSHLNCHPDAGRWALTPPVALHPGAVLDGVAKSATQYTVCPQQAKGLLWFSLSDGAVGADERAPPEYRSGHVHPEQELWGGNCALFLRACAEGRAEEKAPGATAKGEASQTGLQRHH